MSTEAIWAPTNESAAASRRRLLSIGLVVLVAVVWFGVLDFRHLVPSDEGRYAEIAREMFVSGDWVTIRYNALKYFEKPPFHLWATAVAYTLFGVGEWQARLWVGLSGAVGIVFTMLAARAWFGSRVAWLAGLVLLATPGWTLAAHFNSLDAGVAAALTVALASLLLAQQPGNDVSRQRRWMLAAWAAMAVAVLTKGLIGVVLPGLALVVYTLWTRDFRLWRELHIGKGVLLLLAITVPWFWLVQQRNPEFFQFFFIHEHLQRYTSTVHNRSGPVWYFVPQLVVGFLPWLGLWPRIARAAVVGGPPGGGNRALRPHALLACWALTVLVFFSASGSKLPGYIVPMFPPLAMLAAVALDGLPRRRWRWMLASATAVSLLMLATTSLVAGLPGGERGAAYAPYAPWLAAAALVLVAGCVGAWLVDRRGLHGASIVTYALAMYAGTTIGATGHESLGRGASGVDLVPAMRAVLTPDMPIYGVNRLDHTLPFYLERPFVMVVGPDELAFGTQQEPDKWVPTLDEFGARWTSPTRALAVMTRTTHATLQARGLRMFTIGEDARRIVVANFEPGR